jgi:ubiquinone/menaquinone biosynthesis C-methylase UbiE
MRNIEIMLNQCFSRKIEGVDLKKYVLPDYLGPIINRANENFDTGRELRLQKVYTYELWARLESLGLGSFDWANKKTLDICCGTGYLSYHLLQRASPKELTLLDISEDEVGQAKALLSKEFPAKNISYVVGDALNSGLPDKSFDVIIGNSFLHTSGTFLYL